MNNNKKINHKSNKDKNIKPIMKESGKKRRKICSTLTLVIALALLIIGSKIYKDVTTIPELPDFDLNEWWGKNTTDGQQDTSIRRFKVVFTDSMEQRLNQRFNLNHQRSYLPSLERAAWNYGINSEALNEVSQHWHYKYDFRQRQKFMNQFDHFKTNIQGLDVHFLHVRPKVDREKVLPLLMIHGWPGSIREFYEVLPLLTAPRSGYNNVFEVIVPSLPGFVYSQAPSRPGLGPVQIAIIMRNLMHRLGFKQFYIQGGGFGHVIGSLISTIFPNEVLGFHSNSMADFSHVSTLSWILGGLWPSLVVDEVLQDRLYPLKDKFAFYLEESGFVHIQGTKPDTIGVALHDSPLGLAAYIIDRFMVLTNPSNKNLTDGGLSNYYNLNALLDNVMLYWTTDCITTSMRLYKESFYNRELLITLLRIPTSVPTWGLQARYELIFQPEWMIKKKFPNLQGTTQLKDGGHFITFEKPAIVADDIYKAVKSFQDFHNKKTEL